MDRPLPSAKSWAVTLEIARRGEAVLDGVFGPEFIIVKASRHHERQGIDRFLIHRRDGRVIYRVDYKADEAAARTGRLALEHVSVMRDGRPDAAGWVHTTIAELVVSFVPRLNTAFVLEVTRLREAWSEILRRFPPREAATEGTAPYASLVCPVPIRWLEARGLIVRRINTTGTQLRLPLTARRGPGQNGVSAGDALAMWPTVDVAGDGIVYEILARIAEMSEEALRAS